MNAFEKFAMRLTRSRKRRKIISRVMVGFVISFAVIFGAMISVLTAPVDARSNIFNKDETERIGAIQANVEYRNGIPMIDSAKIAGTYPWPLDGAVTCNYGWRVLYGEDDFHGGLDISTGKNDPIIAIADGVVEQIGIDKKSYGLYVLINHDDGFYTLCAHLAKIYVKEGDRVKQGEKIALEGGEPGVDPYPGRSTGRHLHFEVRQTANNNSRMNPLLFLNK